ncbi:MAG: transketolase family protein [Bacillota bacterium]
MTKKIATREAYGTALVELGAELPGLIVLDADLSGSTKTSEFKKAYPERFFNVGIAEQNLLGTAAGLALAGKIPFASTFAVFATGRAYEQIRNSIAYPRLNVKVAATHAGLTVGPDGASHQALEDIALMRAIPNLTVIVPADAVEARLAVREAARLKGPVYLRFSREATPVIFDEDYEFDLRKAQVVRPGRHVTIVATGVMVSQALQASEQLEAMEGISAEVINVSVIKPLDVRTILESAEKTGCVVTAEEHSIIGGLGSAVAETLVENLPVPMTRVGVLDKFGESGSPEELLRAYGLDAEAIVYAVRRVIMRRVSSKA